jgi:hypothetical protein
VLQRAGTSSPRSAGVSRGTTVHTVRALRPVRRSSDRTDRISWRRDALPTRRDRECFGVPFAPFGRLARAGDDLKHVGFGIFSARCVFTRCLRTRVEILPRGREGTPPSMGPFGDVDTDVNRTYIAAMGSVEGWQLFEADLTRRGACESLSLDLPTADQRLPTSRPKRRSSAGPNLRTRTGGPGVSAPGPPDGPGPTGGSAAPAPAAAASVRHCSSAP